MARALEVPPGWREPIDPSTISKATPTTAIDVNSFDPLLARLNDGPASATTVEPDAIDTLGKAMNWAAGEVARTPSAELSKRVDLAVALENAPEVETPMFDAASLFKALIEGQQVEQMRKAEGRIIPPAASGQRERMLEDWRSRHREEPLTKRAVSEERLRGYREKIHSIFRAAGATEGDLEEVNEGVAGLLLAAVEEEQE